MSKWHDFEMGEVVYFKSEYLKPNEDPRQAYVIVNCHPESKVLDVAPVGWDGGPFVPIGMYSYHYFMRISDEIEFNS